MKNLEGKCISCLGCNRLEDINFKGIWRCQYFKEAKDENRNTNEITKFK